MCVSDVAGVFPSVEGLWRLCLNDVGLCQIESPALLTLCSTFGSNPNNWHWPVRGGAGFIGGYGLALDSDYHRRQAATLIRFAQTTRDPDTSAALMRLAAEHIELAEETARSVMRPCPEEG